MREELVHLAQVGVRAGWNFQEPACKLALAIVVHCKVRCDFVAVPDRAGQAKVHDLGLEPRLERAVDVMQDSFRRICVVEAPIPVALRTAAVWPGVAVVGPGQVLLELQIVVLQPEDVQLERVGCFLERLVFATKLEQAHIEEHLADGRKPFDALHGTSVNGMGGIFFYFTTQNKK